QGCVRWSSVRIDELLPSCFVGDTTRRFVELRVTGANEVRDSSLTVEFFDGAGASVGRVSASFGTRAGEPWPANTSWLLATDSLGNAIGSRPDAPLGVRPDTTAGTLRLTRTDPFDPTHEEMIQELRWGAPYARLLPGQ